MIKIPLSGKKGENKSAIIDDEDYDMVSKIKWFDVGGYARSRDGVAMHRLIMSPPSNMEIDHKNHNRLDNRKNNLKICTRQENARNITRKGYYYDKGHKYWVVRRGTKSRIFHTEEEAINASKLWDSGKVRDKKYKVNKYRPKYIHRNRLSNYSFSIQIDGVVYNKYGFKSIAEAVEYRDNFLLERNISL